MRLVKQTCLYFKEGNSDKVYEIDLCEVGNEKYVVNFRYGRKGSPLKEGSKTPVPVSLAEAESKFNSVENEKLNKGYTTSESGISSIPASAGFTLATETGIVIPSLEAMPNGRTRSILQRLQQAVQGNTSTARKAWKLSRVIWKAGEYKIAEAAPYIIKLFNNGNVIHQYSAVWTLARCGNDIAVPALKAVYKDHPVPFIAKIAGAGLMNVLTGAEKEKHFQHYINALPEALKAAIENNQQNELAALLQDRITQLQQGYNWLETVYLISVNKKWVRPILKKILWQIPLKPNYFKHIRAIFKLAELLDDFEISGVLTCRIEREEEFFSHNVPVREMKEEVYIEELEEYLNPHTELKKKNSRLAYSQKTRWYLHQRTMRRLQMMGKINNTDYVKLATSLLIAYDRRHDFREAFSTSNYQWSDGNYINVETRFPQNAQAVLMHKIISGDDPHLQLLHNHIWRFKPAERPGRSLQQRRRTSNIDSGTTDLEKIAAFFKKIIANLFGKKKEPSGIPTHVQLKKEEIPLSDTGKTPYLHLWNELPQSYIQLLIGAQMDEIHEFALTNLITHPAYTDIKEKLGKEDCKKLLLATYPIPADFGYRITAEKYLTQMPEPDLVMAMLNSQNKNAVEKGKQWAEAYQADYLQQSEFVKDLVFATHPEIRNWAKELLLNNNFTSDQRKVIAGKAVVEMMAVTTPDEKSEATILAATDTLFELFGNELAEVPLSVIADLLLHKVAPVLLFGLRLLQAQKEQLNPNNLNKSLLFGLLQHSYTPVRDTGISFLASLNDEVLLQYQNEVIVCCTSSWQNVRQGLRPVIQRMAQKDNVFGNKAAETLMPYLLRKETSEGLHADLSQLLCKELSGHLQNANKETALNLLYSNYNAAQDVGVVILEKYTDPAQLTIPQVIALGNHENLNVRNWCWNFYNAQIPRIKYEKETSIKLLESKWQDTRQFAMQYFRKYFSENDWTPEVLITLADSVKPETEAFGRELITKFFTDENGTRYLLKLSQHPGEKMQLFATNYLERFAADDVEKIQSLGFYFRAVLTSVNKSRIAKSRIYQFLLTEGRKSELGARTVSGILSDISATAAIGDKAKCIDILLQIRALYDIDTPLTIKPIETRA